MEDHKRTLHLVSHTHWDREWYLTFQQFRLKLVHLIDKLLALLETDPDYEHFMLDGQTIVLDDYLLIRPEREAELCAHVQSGRLLIGPWHILPDEFLVSPEATIRNLLQGDRTARRFGSKMKVGYVPDPFGHIGQMPQILRGFDIDTAAFRRGLSDEPCEVWWQAPDGSRVFTAYLRDGYDNAAWLSLSKFDADPDRVVSEIRRLRDSLARHTATDHILLMHGTDHLEPHPSTSAMMAYAHGRLDGDVLIHSTLSDYLAAIRNPKSAIPNVVGELRSPRRHHLLPGVLSTRMWIKQRNHACETLLEKWAEPFSAWAGLAVDAAHGPDRLYDPAPILRQAWRLLMECHPHDSICGCSVDQVHREMRTRFDQAEQIAEEVTRQSLQALAPAIDTGRPEGLPIAIVAFNPTAGPRTDAVTISLQLPAGVDEFEIVDAAGAVQPHDVIDTDGRVVADMTVDRDTLQSMLGLVQAGKVADLAIRDAGFRRAADTLQIDIVLTDSGEPDAEAMSRGLRRMEEALADDTLKTFVVRARSSTSHVQFVARDVPGYGYRTFWLRLRGDAPADVVDDSSPWFKIENECLTVEASVEDGTLAVTDKRTGARLAGLNRFVDGGDCGDQYNYCPPPVDGVARPDLRSVGVEGSHVRPTIVVTHTLDVPVSLTDDRRTRSSETVPLTVTSRVSVVPGVARVDIVTEVANPARDHRLRVHFPTPIAAHTADHDGHFEVVRRPIGVPVFDESWVEQPRPEVPQRAFTDVSDGGIGLMIANQGLPEVEVLSAPAGSSEIALTLLRCVGWLSRDDFATRRGHAGPAIATPDAQMIGSHRFEYAIIPHSGGWQTAYHEAYAFEAPMRAVVTDGHPGSLPGTASFLRVEPAGFVISAVKTGEDGGWVVRGYNIGSETIEVRLTPWQKFHRAARVRLDEQEELELAQAADGGVTFSAGGHQIVTVKFDS